ncbi:hypothetical protein BKA70DRAFT_1404253 [Coprinopsis sp. MPI-PUGE-AT-0042]|nr:hypothetical protein BKA70DRAFT_1404253 [Coprinopsis sp. MPI-PUGE-AT-0042]
MRSLTASIGLLALGLGVAAQIAEQWCDPLSTVCFHRFHNPSLDIGWGYLFPSTPSDEFIGIFTAPASVGWIGNSLGGGMNNNPLVIGWTDGGKAVVSVRSTTSYSPPLPMSGPKVTILGTSGANSTHQRIVYRCQNCTTWSTGSINLEGISILGYATHGALKPNVPSDPNSTLYQHTLAAQHALDTVAARSSTYQAQLSQLAGAPPLAPGTPSSTTTSGPTPTGSFSCPGAPVPSYVMNVASGWKVAPVLGGLRSPRGVIMDSRGQLLVVQRGLGITGHTLDSNGCVTSSKTIVANTVLNHGIDVLDNKLYASSSDIAWSWDYDAATMQVSNQRVLVTGMHNPGHVTRTLHVSRKYPNFISISVGSDGNVDLPSFQAASGRAQIRVFDLRNLPSGGAAYNSSYGKVFGYGLRNDVGIAEDRTGTIFSIENSVDNAYRRVNGVERDIHTDNPAEKVYRLGNPSAPNGTFHGYPTCFSAWDHTAITDKSMQPGDWFVQDTSGQYSDEWCNANAIKPLALLPPHTAPLDLKFGVRQSDTNLYVPLHGSWNRSPPQGYKVVVIPGQYSGSGSWSPSTSLSGTKTSFTDLLSNRDENQCQGGCFRPVALVFSPNGDNLYVTSDTSGEVFLLKPPGGTTPPPSTTAPPSTTSRPPTTTSRPPSTTTNVPGQPTQTVWGQCGGNGYTGPKVCASGSTCKVMNEWYHQCVPA